MAGGIPTRRSRANSASSGPGKVNKEETNVRSSSKPVVASLPSTRHKRRKRSSSSSIPDEPAPSTKRSKTELKRAAKTSSPDLSKSMSRESTKPSPRSTRRTSSTPLESSSPSSNNDGIPNSVEAIHPKSGKSFQVTVKVQGEVLFAEKPIRRRSPSTRKSTRHRSATKDSIPEIPIDQVSSLPDINAVKRVPIFGNDGNLFHCQMCDGFGDVVCCDGCPHVYHRGCVPVGKSRKSLENDEDPWYCPACFPGGKSKANPDEEMEVVPSADHHASGSQDLPSDQCKSSTGSTPVQPEEQATDHDEQDSVEASASSHLTGSRLDSIPEGSQVNGDSGDPVAESNGIEESGLKTLLDQEAVDDAETKTEETMSIADGLRARRRARSLSVDRSQQSREESGDEKTSMGHEEGEHEAPTHHEESSSAEDRLSPTSALKSPPQKTTRKKARLSPVGDASHAESMDIDEVTTPRSKSEKSKKKKKKKKKKHGSPKNSAEHGASVSSPKKETVDMADILGSAMMNQQGNGGSFRATPAFFFFLSESRLKIERSLSRKHRIFNRLPKGIERNELVVNEAALWWTKLSPSEVRRYVSMSMREFEQKIIAWKEEKNLREMLGGDNEDSTALDHDSNGVGSNREDELLTYQNHERLYLGTTVGCKPYKPESGTSHNIILLELLQDMRFHPVPMIKADRTENEYGEMAFSRITIPFFDVHGPISTSIGDECLGCTRGWTHFCNVLKRRVPSIEHRAKLQPPLSSLMATRVGLGLRNRPTDGSQEGETEEEGKNIPLFGVREMPEATTARNAPAPNWDSLSDPSKRVDDIVQFIEESVYMKVPEPNPPSLPGRSLPSEAPAKKSHRASLPLRPKRGDQRSDTSLPPVLNKCGRCRTVIQTDTGCVPCRRAQLVINMSKRGARDGMVNSSTASGKSGSQEGQSNGKLVKCQTNMLGRINMKEGSGEVQTDGNLAIAAGMLRQRWTPFTILPPCTVIAPSAKRKRPLESNELTAEDTEVNVVNPRDPPHAPVAKLKDPPRAPEVKLKDPPATDTSGKAKVLPVHDEENEKHIADAPNDDESRSSSPKEEGTSDKIEDGGESHMSSRLVSKRLRSARSSSVPFHEEVDEEPDRQEEAKRFKEEARDLQKRCLSISCCGILLALMRRDPLILFATPVSAEGYSTIVKNPIDFGKIRSSVLDGKYSTLGAFVADCRLLCTNALAYNPPGSIYWKTAKILYDVLQVMQKRALKWTAAIKDAHTAAWRRSTRMQVDENSEKPMEDAFEELRQTWPEAVEMLEDSEWLRTCLSADFIRTRENETAYYGALAIRRTACAAEASLAPYPDSGAKFNTVSRRSHNEDALLRGAVDDRVRKVINPVELKDQPTWREESIIRVLRRAQTRRLEGRIGSANGSARCDGTKVDQELKMAMKAETVRWGRTKRNNNEVARVHPSRAEMSTGLGSQKAQERQAAVREEMESQNDLKAEAKFAGQVAVSVRGSKIHGWGLYADQHFKEGDVVAEYIGEYVSLAVTEAREKMYQDQRIQDYQFRLDEQLVIDATMRGGHGRYINHNCSPNCVAKMVSGDAPDQHLKQVIIIAQQDIKPHEELTYDYQFPLELDLNARIPCNCHSEHCRGFMNWDLPEKGSNNRMMRSQKRGANMRDRIRRLGRPLKGEKDGKEEDG